MTITEVHMSGCAKRGTMTERSLSIRLRESICLLCICIRHMDAMAGSKVSYREGLMDAFGTLYGQEEADRLWEYLDKRRERMTRLINHMQMGGKLR